MMRWIVTAAVVGALALGVAMVVRGSGRRPDQPTAIAWDRETCAECRMHIGEPRHAAQLVTEAGAVLSFDDPACALRWIAAHPGPVHRLWFHGEGERWIPADRAAFVAGGASPMASGLLAVEAGTPGARPFAEVAAALPGGGP